MYVIVSLTDDIYSNKIKCMWIVNQKAEKNAPLSTSHYKVTSTFNPKISMKWKSSNNNVYWNKSTYHMFV